MIQTRSTSWSNNIGKSSGSQGPLMTTESMSSLSGSTTTVETTAIDNFPEDTVEESATTPQKNIKSSLLDLAADWTTLESNSCSTNLPSGLIESTNSLAGRSIFCTRSAPGMHLTSTSSYKKSTSPPTINSSPDVYQYLVSPSLKSTARVDANNSQPVARSTDW